MIPFINNKLNLLDDWRRTGRVRLGYPKQSAFVGATQGAGAAITLPDDEAMELETAVAALEPRLRAAVELYYGSMKNCTGEQIAKQLGCSRDTVYHRIDRAHALIMGYLNDIAAGVPVRAGNPFPQPEPERRASRF